MLRQWHSLSDRQLEHSIKVRVDFRLFCGVSFHRSVLDHTTLYRFRNMIVDLDFYNGLLREVSRQLEALRVKLILADVAKVIAEDRNEYAVNCEEVNVDAKYACDKDTRWLK